jgi:hypothetical protein
MVCRGNSRTSNDFAAQSSHTSPPNVSSATARLRAFSFGYRDSFLPNRRPSPKIAKSAAQSYRPLADDTLGGDGFTERPIGHHCGRFRAIVWDDGAYQNEFLPLKEKAPPRFAANPQRRAKA